MFVSVVLPCLNERATVADTVREAYRGLEAAGLQGEVIVADNGSADGSQDAAQAAGANVVHCAERGYGAALRAGFAAVRGDVLVMADADGTYDLTHLPQLVGPLRRSGPGGGDDLRFQIAGCRSEDFEIYRGTQQTTPAPGPLRRTGPTDMVIGNRFAGGIETGAMRWSHRYVGVPALTWLLNRLFGTRIGDAHCGLRAFTRQAYEQIDPQSSGMEFGSELIVRAAQLGMHIEEVPTVLRAGPQGRVPHLRTLRDGCRHVSYLFHVKYEERGARRKSQLAQDASQPVTQQAKPLASRRETDWGDVR